MTTQAQVASTPEVPSVFQFKNHPVRTITINDEIWFVATDVCEALEIVNVTNALRRLDDDETTLLSIKGQPGSGPQAQNLINESGLYSLVLGSRKPDAKKFKKWVTSEVLPAIRRTGCYTAPASSEHLTPDQLRALQEAVEARTKELTPKAKAQSYPKLWGALKSYFRVASYKDIPATGFDEALSIIGRLEIHEQKASEQLSGPQASMRRIYFPKETALPKKRELQSEGWLTARELLNHDNPKPIRDILNILTEAGFNVEGARCEYDALRFALEQYRNLAERIFDDIHATKHIGRMVYIDAEEE